MFTNDFFRKLKTQEFEAILNRILKLNAQIRARQAKEESNGPYHGSTYMGIYGLMSSIAPKSNPPATTTLIVY